MKKIALSGLVLAATMLCLNVNAQPGPPSGGGSGTSAPVDGAAGALLVSVVAYGYTKLKKKKTEVVEQISAETK
jgi:hypothetical protein